jgi:hypothetical protein
MCAFSFCDNRSAVSRKLLTASSQRGGQFEQSHLAWRPLHGHHSDFDTLLTMIAVRRTVHSLSCTVVDSTFNDV